jgi:hypothetical protein
MAVASAAQMGALSGDQSVERMAETTAGRSVVGKAVRSAASMVDW